LEDKINKKDVEEQKQINVILGKLKEMEKKGKR